MPIQLNYRYRHMLSAQSVGHAHKSLNVQNISQDKIFVIYV
jgi:hypothetical protein